MSQRLRTSLITVSTAGAIIAFWAFSTSQTVQACITLFAIAVAADMLAHAWNGLPRTDAYGWGALSAIAILMIVRTFWFYAGLNLNGWGDVAPVVIVVLMAGIWRFFKEKSDKEKVNEFRSRCSRTHALMNLTLPALSLSGAALIAYAAYRAGTAAAIRTPWTLLPPWTLPVIGILFALPAVSAWRQANRWIIALQGTCALAAVASIAPLVYRLGYGFDGFLHVAGERVLLDTGVLSPKPMYYIGQYVTTTWIAKIAEISIASVDRWLVPVASAILIPFALTSVSRGHSEEPPSSLIPAVILLPLAAFVATTPNGFAMTLAVVALIASIGTSKNRIPQIIPLLFAAWSALTHPLVGLPVFIAISAYQFVHFTAHVNRKDIEISDTLDAPLIKQRPRRPVLASLIRIFCLLLATLSGFSIPILFGLSSAIGSNGVTFAIGKLADMEAWASLARTWIPYVGNHFAIWADASVWIEKILPLILIALAVGGAILTRRTSAKHEGNALFLIAAASAAAAAIILHLAGDFEFLIDYERGNYAARLWSVAWILLLPLAIPAFGRLLEHAKNAAPSSSIAILLSIGLLGAGSTYAALPRHDAVTPSRGWSVSEMDIDAVKLIERDAAGNPYTVLANQSVSAAAVRTLGFKRYNGDVFFYPIPTGGALYNAFLTASYGNPSRETMTEAAHLGGSSLVYFVVNDYWWKANELIETARASADRVFVVGDGKVTVFRYDLH